MFYKRLAKIRGKLKNENSEILKKQIISICFKVSSVILTLILTKVFISVLGFERYGNYVLIHGYLIVLSAIIGSGYGVLFLKENTLTERFDYKIILKLLLAVFINITVVVVVIVLINTYFNLFSNELIYSVIFYSLNGFFVEFIRSKTNGNIYIFLKDVTRTLMLMILVIAIPNEKNIFLINVSSALALICIVIYLMFLFFKYGFVKTQSAITFQNLYINGGLISMVLSSQFLKIRLDIFLVDLFFNKTLVGMYDVLMKLGQIINLPQVALNADLAKQFANSIKLNEYNSNLKKRIKITKYLGYLAAFCCVLILPIYLNFYGYETNMNNLLLALLVIIIPLISCYFGPVGLFAQLSTLKNYFLKAQILTIISSSIITYLLVQPLGIFAIALTNASLLFLTNYFIHKKIKNKYNFSV